MKAQICPLLGSPFPKTEVAMKAVLRTNPLRRLFTSERDHRIDLRRPPRRNVARQQRRAREQ